MGGLLGMLDTSAPCWLGTALMAAQMVYLHLVWQETLPPGLRTATFDWRNASPLPALSIFVKVREYLYFRSTYLVHTHMHIQQ
jgi:hypothetical protein